MWNRIKEMWNESLEEHDKLIFALLMGFGLGACVLTIIGVLVGAIQQGAWK